MERIQEPYIVKDLQKKMVFLVGPRQAGKTWLAKHIAQKYYKNPVYLNYDFAADRKQIENTSWLKETDLLIFDEIHKMPEWKNYVKGVFDTREEHTHILVTGSARLDTFRQSGDSMAGRFFVHRLFPFSYQEIQALNKTTEFPFAFCMQRSGFPEPLFSENDADADRWRNQYFDGLIRNDILDFENIHNLKSFHLLVKLLQTRVGSLISYASLAIDLQISPITVKKYIEILESLYIIFRVSPSSKNIARSLQKESKIYFFDTGLVKGNIGKLYENYLALCLLQHTYFEQDVMGTRNTLGFIRTKDGKEIDFCFHQDGENSMFIEAKYSDTTFDKNLIYFYKKYGIPSIQTACSLNLNREKQEDGLSLLSVERFLETLQSFSK